MDSARAAWHSVAVRATAADLRSGGGSPGDGTAKRTPHARQRTRLDTCRIDAAVYPPEARGAAHPGGVLLAAFRPHLSQGLSRGLAARPPYPAQIRGLLRRRAVRAGGGAGRAAYRGTFSACLSRRQSRALRARPRAVQRPAAGFCQYPVGPRGGRARHHRQGGGRYRGDLSRAAADRGRVRAHRAPVSAVPRGPGRPAGGDPQALRHGRS